MFIDERVHVCCYNKGETSLTYLRLIYGFKNDIIPTKDEASGGVSTLPLALPFRLLPSSLTYLSRMYLQRSLASSTVAVQNKITFAE